jgi:hypothetical protein
MGATSIGVAAVYEGQPDRVVWARWSSPSGLHGVARDGVYLTIVGGVLLVVGARQWPKGRR